MDSIPSQILLQIILILINAFFAATEIAVLSLNANHLEKKAENGEKTAKRLLILLKEPASFLSTIQIGITLAGFLASAFAAENFSGYLVDWIYNGLGFTALPMQSLDAIAVIVITLILSYFTLVFGELVPKRIAMQKPYEVAKISCGTVLMIAKVVKPAVSFLSLSTNGILKLMRLKTEAEEETVTEEDIIMMVELGEKRGVLDNDESEWIQNVFDFGDTCIKEIMTHSVDVVMISTQTTQQDIIHIIQDTGLSRYPVYDQDENNIIGILHTRDYLLNLQTKEKNQFLDLLTPAYFIPESMSADDLFDDMQSQKVHIAIVIDEFGEVSGIITLEDLVEEIVGNIYDEHDKEEQPLIQSLNNHQWKINGNTTLDELTQTTGIILPEDENYDTVGGYVLSHFRSIPKDGSTKTIHINDLSFQIIKIQDRRIKEIIITLKNKDIS